MISDEMKNKITDLLFEQLPEKEAAKLQAEISADHELLEEYNSCKNIIEGLEKIRVTKPPQQVLHRFEHWLESEIQSSQNPARQKPRVVPIWKYAIAASVLLLIGYMVGHEFWSGNQAALKQAESKRTLLQLVANESTTGRIEGINQSWQMAKLDSEVLEVLLSVLENDKSTNVRLAALEALVDYIDMPEVKTRLIELLKEENEPIIQISMIKALVNMKGPDVKSTLQHLLDREQLSDDVKEEALLNITRL